MGTAITKSKSRVILYGWICVFFTIVFFPIFQSMFVVLRYEPVDEFRRKTELQSITYEKIAKSPQLIIRNLEEYYNDRYGMRDLLIRTKYQLYYTLFGSTDRLHIGKGDWLFYRGVTDRDQVVTERSGLEVVYSNIPKLYEYLKKRGIRLVIISVPAKNTFYPEKVPATVPKRPNKTAFHYYREFLNSQNGLIHIDAQEILKRVGDEIPMFYRTDGHWNEIAGFHVAKAVVNTLARTEGLDGNIWAHSLETHRKELVGWQSRFIPMLIPLKESGYYVTRNWKETGKWVSPPPEGYEYHFQNDTAGERSLSKTIMFGSSFTIAISNSGFYLYFRELSWVHPSKVSLSELLKNLPGNLKYLVILLVETQEDTFFGKSLRIPTE